VELVVDFFFLSLSLLLFHAESFDLVLYQLWVNV